MRLNEKTVVRGEHITLVPYEECHVSKYHSWMEAESLRLQTASERLTLAEELEMQKKWREDDDKLTFIILTNCDTGDEISRMIGDVNLFFTGPTDKSSAEIEVMIADDHYRGKGLGSEALKLMMIYAYDSLRCAIFEAKIGVDNGASLKLFRKLGFQDLNFCDFFKEFHLQLNISLSLRNDWVTQTHYELGSYNQ